MAVLVERLEQAVNKFRDRRDKMRQPNGSMINGELAQKEADLKSAQLRAIQVKRDIVKVKRQLEGAFDLGQITNMENEIKNKE